MPTRVYLPSQGAAIGNPAFDGSWNDANGADRIRAVAAKSNTPRVSRLVSHSVIIPGNALFRQYVTDPLNAGSVSGTVKGIVAYGLDSDYTTFSKAQVVIRVVNNAGTIVRGTLLATNPSGYGTDHAYTPQSRYAPPAATALTGVTALQSDRIVIEIGARILPGSAYSYGNLSTTVYGDITASGDFLENETQSAETLNPWIEFSQALSWEPGGGPPPPVATAPLGGAFTTPREQVDWRMMLCDLNGVALADITRIARDKQLSYELNRAASCGFTVPSDHAFIKTLHSDGYPLLRAKMRTIKAYRYEGANPAVAYGAGAYGADPYGGGGAFILRFAGTVDVVEDGATGDTATTRVVCFDPLKHLEARLCRDSAGLPSNVSFDGDQAAQIARILVERANAIGITGLVTTGTYNTTPTRIVDYQNKSIAAALTELAAVDFDLYLGPIDAIDGSLCALSCFQQLGVDRPDVILAWGAAPASASGATRIEDGSQLVNVIVAVGAGGLTTTEQSDATSIGRYRRHEAVVTYSDITDSGYLTSQAQAELAVRKDLREKVVMTPASGRAAEPFSHFFLGDTIRTRAGSDLRGGFIRTDRVYAFTLLVDDDGSEQLTSVTLAASV